MKLRITPFVLVMVRYGAIAGLLCIVLLVAIYYMGQHPLLIMPYLDYRILLFGLFIFFGLREFRDYNQNGILYFWQGLVGSYLVVFIASVIGALGLIVFAKVEPRFVTSYIDTMLQNFKAFPQESIERIGKEVYERNLKLLPSTNSTQLAITYFGQGIIIGIFISVILSVILRKQPKTL